MKTEYEKKTHTHIITSNYERTLMKIKAQIKYLMIEPYACM